MLDPSTKLDTDTASSSVDTPSYTFTAHAVVDDDDKKARRPVRKSRRAKNREAARATKKGRRERPFRMLCRVKSRRVRAAVVFMLCILCLAYWSITSRSTGALVKKELVFDNSDFDFFADSAPVSPAHESHKTSHKKKKKPKGRKNKKNKKEKKRKTTGLPAGWKQYTDKASGALYYHHKQTGVTQWEPPVQSDTTKKKPAGETAGASIATNAATTTSSAKVGKVTGRPISCNCAAGRSQKFDCCGKCLRAGEAPWGAGDSACDTTPCGSCGSKGPLHTAPASIIPNPVTTAESAPTVKASGGDWTQIEHRPAPKRVTRVVAGIIRKEQAEGLHKKDSAKEAAHAKKTALQIGLLAAHPSKSLSAPTSSNSSSPWKLSHCARNPLLRSWSAERLRRVEAHAIEFYEMAGWLESNLDGLFKVPGHREFDMFNSVGENFQDHREILQPMNLSLCPGGFHRLSGESSLLTADVVDAGKMICGMEYYKQLSASECMAFSVGSNGQFDFEHEWLAETGCPVHTFDCTYKASSVPAAALHTGNTYHEVCLGGKKHAGEAGKFMTLREAVAHACMAQHYDQQHRITYMKMDIEGFEFPILEEMVAEAKERGVQGFNDLSTFLPFQMTIEIHERVEEFMGAAGHGQHAAQSHGVTTTKRMVGLARIFHDLGYRIIARENNFYGKAVEITLMRFRC